MVEQDKGSDTGDYSATKAPENREHVESKRQSNDSSLKPGGLGRSHGRGNVQSRPRLHRQPVSGSREGAARRESRCAGKRLRKSLGFERRGITPNDYTYHCLKGAPLEF